MSTDEYFGGYRVRGRTDDGEVETLEWEGRSWRPPTGFIPGLALRDDGFLSHWVRYCTADRHAAPQESPYLRLLLAYADSNSNGFHIQVDVVTMDKIRSGAGISLSPEAARALRDALNDPTRRGSLVSR